MRWTVLLLIVLAGLTFFAWLGRPAITDSDEAFYAESAREMVESGDYLTPHYNYEPRFQKPVLFYWLIAGTYAVAGISEFAARFWAAVAGLGLVLLTAAAAARWYDARTAGLAGVIAATSFGYFAMARLSLPDLPLAFFVTLTTWTAGVALFDAPRRPLAWLLVSGAAAGLAFLTKGPVGVVLPAVVLLPLAGLERQRLRARPMHLAAAAAVFVVVAAPWYVEMWRIHGAEYYRSFFIGDNLERFATTRYNDPRGFYYYVPIVLAGLLPWSPFLLLLAPPVVRLVRDRRWPSTAATRLLAWSVVPLLLLTVSVGKQPRYILPVLPPLAILVARQIAVRVARSRDAGDRDLPLGFAATLSGILLVGFGLLLYLLRPLLIDVSPLLVRGATVAVWFSAAPATTLPWTRAWRWAPAAVAGGAVVTLLAAQYVVLAPPRPEPVERVAAIVRAQLPQAAGWMAHGDGLFVRNLVFYVGQKESGPYPREAVADVLRTSGRMVVVMGREDLLRLEVETGLRLRRLAEVLYFNTASLTPRRLLWPDPSRDIRTVVVAVAEP